jgi:hypothetical protein
MATNFLEPYITLEELFEAEQSAFEQADTQMLAALAPQIQQCCKKVADLEKRFPELSEDEVKAVKESILRLQQHVGRSRSSWEQYQLRLEKERNLLKSSKRFVHQAKLEQSNRSPRISHSA